MVVVTSHAIRCCGDEIGRLVGLNGRPVVMTQARGCVSGGCFVRTVGTEHVANDGDARACREQCNDEDADHPAVPITHSPSIARPHRSVRLSRSALPIFGSMTGGSLSEQIHRGTDAVCQLGGRSSPVVVQEDHHRRHFGHVVMDRDDIEAVGP